MPYQFRAKEGLALINGTQYITAVGTHAYVHANQALNAAHVISALSLVGIKGHRDAFRPEVGVMRPQPQQAEVAAIMMGLTEPGIVSTKDKPQDAYSWRCIPQVHGVVQYLLKGAQELLATEANSSTDNPLVIPEKSEIFSAGNFHGQYPATACDAISTAAKNLITLSEARVKFLCSSQRRLPPFLVENPGLNSGMMTYEIAVSAHAAKEVILYSTHSRTTGGGQEDHVSMGPLAARQALNITDHHLVPVLAIELMCAVQAIRLQQKKDPNIKVPVALQPVFNAVNEIFPHMDNDRDTRNDNSKVEDFIRTSPLFKQATRLATDIAAPLPRARL